MRQVSWIGTVVLLVGAIALWVPSPGLNALRSYSLSATASVEPMLFLVYLVNELIISNPSLRLIVSVLMAWAALGLQAKTATVVK